MLKIVLIISATIAFPMRLFHQFFLCVTKMQPLNAWVFQHHPILMARTASILVNTSFKKLKIS